MKSILPLMAAIGFGSLLLAPSADASTVTSRILGGTGTASVWCGSLPIGAPTMSTTVSTVLASGSVSLPPPAVAGCNAGTSDSGNWTNPRSATASSVAVGGDSAGYQPLAGLVTPVNEVATAFASIDFVSVSGILVRNFIFDINVSLSDIGTAAEIRILDGLLTTNVLFDQIWVGPTAVTNLLETVSVPLLLAGTVRVEADSLATTSVPEPAALALFGSGLFGLAWLRRRKAA